VVFLYYNTGNTILFSIPLAGLKQMNLIPNGIEMKKKVIPEDRLWKNFNSCEPCPLAHMEWGELQEPTKEGVIREAVT